MKILIPPPPLHKEGLVVHVFERIFEMIPRYKRKTHFFSRKREEWKKKKQKKTQCLEKVQLLQFSSQSRNYQIYQIYRCSDDDSDWLNKLRYRQILPLDFCSNIYILT